MTFGGPFVSRNRRLRASDAGPGPLARWLAVTARRFVRNGESARQSGLRAARSASARSPAGESAAEDRVPRRHVVGVHPALPLPPVAIVEDARHASLDV